MWTAEAKQVTTARPEAVWRRWIEVDKWPEQDDGMEAAHLDGPLAVGTKVIMKPKGSKETGAVITVLEPNRRFTTEAKIPFGFLRFDHVLSKDENGQTAFAHRVSIKGPMTPLLRLVFANKMVKELPVMLANIARLAEKSEA